MYVSQFETTWAVIYTDKYGQIVVHEYSTEAQAQAKLASLK